jgi:uncharacterized protein
MHRRPLLAFAAALALSFLVGTATADDQLAALIVDGQNNHDWKTTTPILRQILERSGRFTVEVATSPPKGEDLSGFRPRFADFDVVVLNYNGESWPKETEQDFVDFVKNGGGVSVIHAANNSFPQWREYNEIIGLGGWGGRDETSGPYVRFRDGEIVRDQSAGRGGSHGKRHEFSVVVRHTEHPIVKGLPREWRHTADELYDRLRGPALQLEVLATAYSDPATGGTGEHEPMIMTVKHGKGRVFHTPMGHDTVSMSGVGFAVVVARGTEWAATGEVTPAEVPQDFPTEQEATSRKYE